MCDVKCEMNYFPLMVLVMALSIRIMILQGVIMLSYSFASKYRDSYSKSNQYSVSPASFKAIYILAIKSALLCANCASFMFAPTLVPLRSTCLLRTNSLLIDTKWRYKLIIRKANDLLSVCTLFWLFTLHSWFFITHFTFHIGYWYHGEHEPVGDGELFKGNNFCFHLSSFSSGTRPYRRRGRPSSMYKTFFWGKTCLESLNWCVFLVFDAFLASNQRIPLPLPSKTAIFTLKRRFSPHL